MNFAGHERAHARPARSATVGGHAIIDRVKWRIRLPKDPARRTLALAIVTSVIFHLFLVVPFVVIPGLLQPAQVISKRGEPLLVDIAPERPEEKAPLGNPSRPVTPPEARERPAPSPPARPPAPARAVEAPRAPAPRPTPAAPAPPQAVAKVEPAPESMIKTPEPRPTTPESSPPSQSAASAPPAAPQVAVARPLDSMRRQPGGGGLTGGGRGGVEGEPIPLDTPEPKYQDYFNKIRERIKANWVYPRQAGERGIEGELLIEFHIAKDGRVAYIELRHSSGTAILDDAALTAVKLAQPFPPVPDEIAKQTLAINGQFKYQIVSGLVNQFLR
jgi:periplasmic protein TonB